MIEGRSKLTFGTGDIMITPVVHNEEDVPVYGMMALENSEVREIGTFEGGNPDYKLSEADVLMVFHKIESVDVMIERLQTLKEMMLGECEDLLSLSEMQTPEDFQL